MKITMDDNFMAVCFEILQPPDELSIFCSQPLMMIIGDNEKRTDADTAAR